MSACSNDNATVTKVGLSRNNPYTRHPLAHQNLAEIQKKKHALATE